jgi:endonuclease/exonuclease/phosphatase family metal-dependent hydrolase
MTPSSLKIISLNIEMDKHLDRIIPFLKNQDADVIVLQEVLSKDKKAIETALGMQGIYLAQNILCVEHGEFPIGLLSLSKGSLLSHHHVFYKGHGAPLIRMTVKEPNKMERAILVIELIKDEQHYCLINTHFTWSANGLPTQEQDIDLESMLHQLAKIPEFILCGDFNAPRGTRIFDTLALRYHDNVPAEVTTTLDKTFHRAGPLDIVVDGVFTTPKYQSINSRVVSGLSDHCALVMTVQVE